MGIIRTAVAELVPQKELQPRAFSIMPLIWQIGSIFGPALGGALVFPVRRFPGVFKNVKLLQEYPFALPNLLTSVLFLVGITSGILFLQETLETRKHRRDYGLALGRLLTRSCVKRPKSIMKQPDEGRPFLRSSDSEMSSPISQRRFKPAEKPVGWRAVFSPQSNINLLVYTLLAMHR